MPENLADSTAKLRQLVGQIMREADPVRFDELGSEIWRVLHERERLVENMSPPRAEHDMDDVKTMQCLYETEEAGLQPMLSLSSGRFICMTCGHIVSLTHPNFVCQCARCRTLREKAG